MAKTQVDIRELALWDAIVHHLKQISYALENSARLGMHPQDYNHVISQVNDLVYVSLRTAWMLADVLPSTPIQQDLVTHLAICSDEIKRAIPPFFVAVPRQLAMDIEARNIKTLEAAMIRAWDWCGLPFRRAVVAPKDLRVQECTEDEYQVAVGMSRSEFLKLTPTRLEAVIEVWKTHTATPVYSPPIDKSQFIKLREINNVLENSRSEIQRAKKEFQAVEEPGSGFRRFRIPLKELRSRQWKYPSEWDRT